MTKRGTKTLSAGEQRRIRNQFGYDFVGYFSSGGFVRARKGGKHFHIHFPSGEPAYEERYDEVGPFVGGKAWVEKNGTRFYIGPDGTKVE